MIQTMDNTNTDLSKLELEKLKNLPIVGEQPASEKEEKFLRELVDYQFQNIEEPGLAIKFSYGDAKRSHRFYMMHGATYKVPRFIARHLESRSTPLYEWRPNGYGSLEKKLIGNKPRFQMRQVFNKG